MATERAYAERRVRTGRTATAGGREAAWPAVAAHVPRSYARAAALGLAALVVAAIVVRALLAQRFPTPWILIDELVYSEVAKSVAEEGRFLLRDVPGAGVGRVYPTLISPAWFADSMSTTYDIAKSVNAVAMSLVAVPAYLWARRLVSPLLALLAAALVLLLPAFVYTGALMTENAAFPLFTLAIFAIALALERPTLWTQAFALATVLLAAGVRTQAVALAGVIVLGTALKLLFDYRAGAGGPRAGVRLYIPMLGALALAAIGYAGVKVAQGADLSSGLGAYSVAVGAGYSWGDVPRWTLHHFAELSLAVGVVPMAALAVLAGLAVVRGLPSAAERAFVAVAVSALVLVIPQVAIFASRFALRIEERNMVYLMPILLLALVVWIGRGLPRPPVIAAVGALGSVALLLTLPLGSLLTIGILSDTFGFVPLLRLAELVSYDLDETRWIMVLGALNAALAFLFLPRVVAAFVLPVLVAGYFVMTTTFVLGEVVDHSRVLRGTIPGTATWIDDRVGRDADVAYLYGSEVDSFGEATQLWQLEFWNRSLGGIYNLSGAMPAKLPEQASYVDQAGRLVGGVDIVRAPYAVAPRPLVLAETPLQEVGDNMLYRVRGPVDVESRVVGVSGDGWMGSEASYQRFLTPGGRPGSLDVELARGSPPTVAPGRVVVEVGPLVRAADGSMDLASVTARRTWSLYGNERHTIRLPTPPPPFGATVHVAPTFSPADYGLADPRHLGAKPIFIFQPSR